MRKRLRKDSERQVRESVMVDISLKLFSKYGFENVSMDDIAKEAQFTKRTLYQYFSNKNDLFFAVVLKGFTELNQLCIKAFKSNGTGFEKLAKGLHAYSKFGKKFPEMFSLMSQAGNMRRNTKNSPMMEKWLQLDVLLFNSIKEVINIGIKDSSISQKLDPDIGTFSLVFLATGFFRLLSQTGNNFADHFSIDIDKFVNYSLNLLLSSVKGSEHEGK